MSSYVSVSDETDSTSVSVSFLSCLAVFVVGCDAFAELGDAINDVAESARRLALLEIIPDAAEPCRIGLSRTSPCCLGNGGNKCVAEEGIDVRVSFGSF